MPLLCGNFVILAMICRHILRIYFLIGSSPISSLSCKACRDGGRPRTFPSSTAITDGGLPMRPLLLASVLAAGAAVGAAGVVLAQDALPPNYAVGPKDPGDGHAPGMKATEL